MLHPLTLKRDAVTLYDARNRVTDSATVTFKTTEPEQDKGGLGGDVVDVGGVDVTPDNVVQVQTCDMLCSGPYVLLPPVWGHAHTTEKTQLGVVSPGSTSCAWCGTAAGTFK